MPERTSAQRIGDAAESMVAARLEAAGWNVLVRNLRLGRDEIDLVAVDPGPPAELVVVEVRWRVSRAFGLPEETIDWAKRRSMRRALAILRQRLREIAPAQAGLAIRVDLVTVEPVAGGQGRPPLVRHHRAIEL